MATRHNFSFGTSFPLFLLWILKFILTFRNVGAETYSDPYIHEATSAEANSEYDFIVIGGGAAGCPLASTLSQKFAVLLLERGGVPYNQPSVYRREGFPWVLATSAAQPFRSVEGVQNRRGNVLGGGSSVNAGFYSRAPLSFINEAKWDAKKVSQAFDWVENQIVYTPEPKNWNLAFRDALLEADILPYNGATKDHIIGTKLGNSLFDEDGYRHTSADLLRAGNATNLKVFIFATVQKIMFNRDSGSNTNQLSARAVVFTDSNGVAHAAFLKPKGEVLLTAGALGSPQLLMLSGIGPKQELEKFNITVLMDLPSLGRNITDIPINTLNILSPLPVEESSLEMVGISPYGNIIEGASGGNHSVSWPSAGELTAVPPPNRTDSAVSTANLVLNLLPSPLRDELNQAGFILSKVYLPLSRGNLTLASTNVNDNPIVSYNYYARKEDIEVCINGTRYLHKILNSTSFSPYKYTSVPLSLRILSPNLNAIPNGEFSGVFPSLPNPDNYTEASQWCKDTVSVIWHFHGGCHRGDCVDDDYKLTGVNALRVVDGSTWHTSPGTNPMATCIMLGRYVGVKILEERGYKL